MKIRFVKKEGNNWKSFEGITESMLDFIYAFVKICLYAIVLVVLWNGYFAEDFNLPVLSFNQSLSAIIISYILTGRKFIEHKVDVIL